MNPTILDSFFKNTYTKNDALRRARILGQVLEQKLFQSSQDLSKQLNPEDLEWLNAMDPQFFQQFNKQGLTAQLNQIKVGVDQINPLTVYVPVELPPTEKKNIGQKLRLTYGPKFLFEIKLNPLLIGG